MQKDAEIEVAVRQKHSCMTVDKEEEQLWPADKTSNLGNTATSRTCSRGKGAGTTLYKEAALQL